MQPTTIENQSVLLVLLNHVIEPETKTWPPTSPKNIQQKLLQNGVQKRYNHNKRTTFSEAFVQLFTWYPNFFKFYILICINIYLFINVELNFTWENSKSVPKSEKVMPILFVTCGLLPNIHKYYFTFALYVAIIISVLQKRSNFATYFLTDSSDPFQEAAKSCHL